MSDLTARQRGVLEAALAKHKIPDRGGRTLPLDRGPAPPTPLTARELAVLELVSRGKTNLEIAGELFVSEETVKTHLRHLLLKLNARNRAHAACMGIRSGILPRV